MRKIRIAIVGPSDSVALIYDVASERSNLMPEGIVYKDASEVSAILEQRRNDFDMWLFSGVVPYRYALAQKVDTPIFYIPHTGSSLYRALLQITYVEHLKIDSLSFDTFSEAEIKEAFRDINVPLPDIYVNSFKGVISASELTEYHYRLWKERKTNIAVTCFSATYETLKRMGVPAVRIWPTRTNIRTTLEIAVNSFEAKRFKGSQLAVQQIAIDDYDDMVRRSSSYEARKVELNLYQILVNYAERLKGSIILRGNGQFTLFSTRGILEEITEDFTVIPILDDIAIQVAAQVSGGIGFGDTAYAAEENAYRALGLSKSKGKGHWMVVTDNREAIGPLSSAVHLKYSVRADSQIFRQFADKLNVSFTTLNKLLASIEKLDRDTLAADDLALYLSITPRSARRLLTNLTEQGLAEVAGEEMMVKGRPRKLYKIDLRSLLRPVTSVESEDNG